LQRGAGAGAVELVPWRQLVVEVLHGELLLRVEGWRLAEHDAGLSRSLAQHYSLFLYALVTGVLTYTDRRVLKTLFNSVFFD
jgi:hypothetical protein